MEVKNMMFFGWILIAVFCYYAFMKGDSTMPNIISKSPKETLDERFVNGEIDEETYMRMKKILEDR